MKLLKYKIVIAIYEGRYFTRKANTKVYLQCQFQHQILLTEPVDQDPDPIWDTQLIWEIEPKLLHYLRTQRSCMKLQCFSIDTNNHRELIGYIMLDLRNTTGLPWKESWHTLVNPRNQLRPEIKLAFSAFQEKDALIEPARANPGLGLESIKSFQIEKISSFIYLLHKDAEEWFEIGVKIVDSNNLEILPEDESRNQGASYSFLFEFLQDGLYFNDFQDLSNNFSENDMLRFAIKGNRDSIIVFLRELDHLDLFLIENKDKLVGKGAVPISDLRLEEEFLSMEVKLYNGFNEFKVLNDGRYPSLKTRVSIRKITEDDLESIRIQKSSKRQSEDAAVENVESSHPNFMNRYRFSIELKSIHNFQLKNAKVYFKYNYSPFGTHATVTTYPLIEVFKFQQVVVPNSYSGFEFIMSTQQLVNYLKNIPLIIELWSRNETSESIQLGFCSVKLVQVFEGLTNNANVHCIDKTFEFFSFGEGNRKICDLRILLTLEELGIVDEVYHDHVISELNQSKIDESQIEHSPQKPPSQDQATRDSTNQLSKTEKEVKKSGENLKKSNDPKKNSSNNELRKSGTELQESKKSGPISPNIDDKSNKKSRIPSPSVPMSIQPQIQENTRKALETTLRSNDIINQGNGSLGSRTLLQEKVNPIENNVIAVEQISKISNAPLPVKSSEVASADPTGKFTYGSINQDLSNNYTEPGALALQNTNAYFPTQQALAEMEIWKKQKELEMAITLRNKEEEMISKYKQKEDQLEKRYQVKQTELNEQMNLEIRKKEKEKDKQVAEKLKGFEDLENKMKSTILELEKREESIQQRENELKLKISENEREKTSVLTEVKDSGRRLHEEFQHKIETEKSKSRDLEQQRNQLKTEYKQLYEEYRSLEEEFRKYRTNQNQSEQGQLSNDVIELREQLLISQNKCNKLQQSKNYYKTQWGKSLQELNEIKINVQKELTSRLANEQHELMLTKMKLLNDALPQLNIKSQKLGSKTELVDDPLVKEDITEEQFNTLIPKEDQLKNESQQATIERMVKEKTMLLSTGVYNEDDELIRYLDKEINHIRTSIV